MRERVGEGNEENSVSTALHICELTIILLTNHIDKCTMKYERESDLKAIPTTILPIAHAIHMKVSHSLVVRAITLSLFPRSDT